MIAIVDYGVGNLFSLKSSFNYLGADVTVTSDHQVIEKSEKIVLPGVGAFADASEKLNSSGLADVVRRQASKSKPLLGICLGMQLLFERSYEFGEHNGLGLIKGNIKPIKAVINENFKVPHIGWNSLIFTEKAKTNKLFKYIKQNDFVYFVHSYFASDCDQSILATVEYSTNLTAAVARDNIYGTQFHPEKSGEVGINILKAFCEI